jgi:predicted  nucleic acid-binding Zn-ribbon protein
MEHRCVDCGEMYFNNEPRTPVVCKKCGGDSFQRTFDEPEYEREAPEEEREDD